MSVIDKIMEGAAFSDWQTITDGRPLLVSLSGGKDSTAVLLWLKEQGALDRCHFVFADTGWEHPEVYRYLDEVVDPLCDGRLVRVRSSKYPGGMADLVRTKGAFPAATRKFCTQELKQFPIRDHIRSLRADGHDVINVIGIRAAESKARSKFEMWGCGGPMGPDVDVWRPLIDWTVQDVIDIHARHNIAPCSLYLRKDRPSKRVGCWPCIRSRKSEIAAVAETTPWRIDEIRALEASVLNSKKDRLGDDYDPDARAAVPTFFQPLEQSDRELGSYPIDKAVSWALTGRGGKQRELFAASEPGCQMWGLCDMGED